MDQARAELEMELQNIKQRIRDLRDAQKAESKTLKQKKMEELSLTLEYVVKEDAIKYLKDNNLSYEYLPKALDVLAAKHDYLNLRPIILLRYFHCPHHNTKFADFKPIENIDYDLYQICKVILYHHKGLRRKAFKKYTPKETIFKSLYDENGKFIEHRWFTYEDIIKDYKD